MQHDEAAIAPNIPPAVMSFWVRSKSARSTSRRAGLVAFSVWPIMVVMLHPVVATGSRGNFRVPAFALQPPAALSIGELSRRTGVNIETIRYYERIKMLPAPPRTASGRRVYGPAEIGSLAFIRRSRELGFTLDEIRALLTLSDDNG